jgi:hypothetical protein
MKEDGHIAAPRNLNDQAFSLTVRLEIRMDPLAQLGDVGANDVIYVRVVPFGPPKDLYAYLLLQDALASLSHGTVGDITQKFTQPGRSP